MPSQHISQRTPSPPVSPGAPSSIYSQYQGGGGGRVFPPPSSYAATQAGVHLGQSLSSAEDLPPRPHSSAFFHPTAAHSHSQSPFADYFTPNQGRHLAGDGDEAGAGVGGFDGAHDHRTRVHNRPSSSFSSSSHSHSSHRNACLKVDPHKPLSVSAKLGLYLMGTNQRKMEKASAQQKEKRARARREKEMKRARRKAAAAGKRGSDGSEHEHGEQGEVEDGEDGEGEVEVEESSR